MAKKIKPGDIKNFMMSALDQFSDDFAHELFDRVVDSTPVDTGELKGSNRLSINKPDFEVGPADPNGSKTKSRADKVKVKAGDEIHISNGAPYANYVENGTTRARPQPFMRVSANESKAIVNKVIKNLK